MSEQPEGIKGFQWYSKAWHYLRAINDPYDKGDDIIITMPDDLSGATIHLAENWLSGSELNGIQLIAYDDSWELLARCIEIIPALAQLENQTMEGVAEMLTGLGYKDLTERVRPE